MNKKSGARSQKQGVRSAGYDMQSADQKALTEATEAYKTCTSH